MENLNNKIWKCPKCETLNQGDYCIVCGEKKPIETPVDNKASFTPKKERTDYETKREKINVYREGDYKEDSNTFTHKKQLLVSGILIIIIVMMISAPIAAIYFNYYKAAQAAEKQNYSEALQYLKGFTTRKGKELKQECIYQSAVQMLNNGDTQKAKNIFAELGEYKNSTEMALQCDYDSAKMYLSQDKLFEAYEILKKISGFSDSQQYLSEVETKIYEKGIELYRSGNLDEAKTYFEKSSNKGREKDYLLLIQAQNGNIDISQLYTLIDFENTKEILLADNYIEKFLMGRWTNSQDYHIEFSLMDNDSSIWCQYSMPTMPDGEHWKIENGKHYCGSDSTGWSECWTYNIVSQNVIEITVKSNGKRYKFTRI